MASMITSAGSASGMDFESIISASVEAKRASLENRVTAPLELANIELSGVGKLKSALQDFQKAIQALTKDNGFNSRKVNINQDADNPYFTVSTKDDAANANYSIDVLQLASTEKLSSQFDKDAKFAAGTLTITLPPANMDSDDPTAVKKARTIEIEVEEGMTLAQLRKKINNNDYGLTASIVSTNSGDRLVIDSGLSGDDNAFMMEFKSAGTSSDQDAIDNANKLTVNTGLSVTKGADDKTSDTVNIDDQYKSVPGNWTLTEGQDAIIEVDGAEVRSSTNEFDGQISGINLTVQRITTEKQDDGSVKKNPVTLDISEDTDAVTTKMQNFVTAYNTLMDTMDALYKHNTYTDGENNLDGGELSGDSMLRSLQSQLQNMMTSLRGSSDLDIYTVGLAFDSDGKMSLDSTDFKEHIKENFNAVVNLFTGEGTVDPNADKDDVPEDAGILLRLDAIIKTYTETNGVLSEREQQINEEIDRYEAQEAENEAYLEQYEESLRQRYGKLDTTIANYNNSLNYLFSALS